MLSQREAVAHLAGVENIKHRTMLLLGYSAGLRVSEIAKLEVTDIDSERMIIHVRQGKGRKDRIVPLSPALLAVARQYWLCERPRKFLFPGGRDPKRPFTTKAIANAGRPQNRCRRHSGMLPFPLMAEPLVDVPSLDLSRDVVSEEELREVIPHREEFQLIDGICHLDLERGVIVGYKDWDENAWWAAGHIPGHPIMPGVLLIEGGAQVATFLIKKHRSWPEDRFVGLGGLDNVRFRGQVRPPARVYFASARGFVRGLRLARYPAEAWCDGKRVMEMELMGVLL